MKYIILSDIHSNLEALDAVLENAQERGDAQFVILGDIIGYGANPNEVIERIQKLERPSIIRGNHDRVIVRSDVENDFNAVAQAAANWTRMQLSGGNTAFIDSLQEGPMDIDDQFIICHGSPLNEDDYIFSEYDAMTVFEKTDFRICFYGHTHYPFVFVLDGGTLTSYIPRNGEVRMKIEQDARYLINPGSIGQPRDRDPRASYLLYDSDRQTVSFVRIPYDVGKAQEKILKAKLPSMLATRLSLGL